MPALHFHGITARQYYGYTNSFRLFVTAMKGMGSVSITSTCSVYCQVGRRVRNNDRYRRHAGGEKIKLLSLDTRVFGLLRRLKGRLLEPCWFVIQLV